MWNWCQESAKAYPAPRNGQAVEDKEDSLTVLPSVSRVLRGGSFLNQASLVRSANRANSVPTDRGSDLGFRAARTLPLGGFTALPLTPEGGRK